MRTRSLSGALTAALTATALLPAVAGAQTAEVCTTDDVTLISEVQGSGSTSPLITSGFEADAKVTVRGVVTNVSSEQLGVYVQEEAADVDDDPRTSEGVFVFSDWAVDNLEVGELVSVEGRPSEYFGNTQLKSAWFTRCGEGEAIAPTPLTLPAGFWDRENVEGMLVSTAVDLTVTAMYEAYTHGDLGVSAGGVLPQPTSLFAPDDPRATELADANEDALLFLDGGTGGFQKANTPWHGEGGRAGDVLVAGNLGNLHYSFGEHRFVALDRDELEFERAPRPAAPKLDGGNDVAAFNVLNFFNDFEGRGARNAQQFADQSTKIVAAIEELDAAVLGLIELENDYEDLYDGADATVPAVQTLVELLNADAGFAKWAFVAPGEDILVAGGLGPDEIANGIIYQPARATEVGTPATFDIDAHLGGEDPDNNRWPLAQTFAVDGVEVTVVVNHFKSKGSTCTDTSGPGFAEGEDVETDLTGNCDRVRTYAAEQLLGWVEGRPTGANTPDVLVVGDLNAYEQEAPVTTFLDDGWEDVVSVHGDNASTYKFDGRFGRLDHVLASPSAKRLVRDAAVWQANSPEPYGYIYYRELFDLTAYASSDHDPVVVDLAKPGKGNGKG